jgi:hypothetical protein
MRITVSIDTFTSETTDEAPLPAVDGGIDVVGFTDDGVPMVQATEDGLLHVLSSHPAPRKETR